MQKKQSERYGCSGMSKQSKSGERNSWPFDQEAAGYDCSFTNTVLGRIYRDAVWERLSALFNSSEHILELGCGTGEDALFLAGHGKKVTAYDAGVEMIEQARAKIKDAGYGERVCFKAADIEQLSTADPGPVSDQGKASVFDGAFSNFGALNCVSNLDQVGKYLHRALKPGAPVILVIMGPYVPWEWLWYLLKGQPGTGFRRLKKGGVAWRGINVTYPSIATTTSAFAPYFRVTGIRALGVFLPPSYVEEWAKAHPAVINILSRLEKKASPYRLFAVLADHYILEMEHIR